MIVGIDIGSTTTKAVSIRDGAVMEKVKTTAVDRVTAATGALGKLAAENHIKLAEIERIVITGVGAHHFEDDIFGVPTTKLDEFTAIGIGGMFLTGKEHIIITNIGTGTAIIEAARDKITHLGGSGMGGGTIMGLAKRMLRKSSFSAVMDLAKRGDLGQVDLLLEDIMDREISFLGKEATAANFGKMLDSAKTEDIALGLLNMMYQTIGLLSVFAAKGRNNDRVIVTGSGSDNEIGQKILHRITDMYGVRFEFPPDAEYTTAIGAGLSGAGLLREF
jgi:type II pantothenate kinase